MLVWGSAGETKDLGLVETRRCDTCEKDRPFKLVLQYRYSHIWYLFSWISRKKYFLLCDVCRRGFELPAKTVEPNLKTIPIPFLRRYGWTFLVGLIAVAIAWGVYDSRAQEQSDYAYIANPMVNDVYVVDVSKLLTKPERSPMYGVMRVKAVRGDQVELFVPKVGYDRVAGATRDVTGGKAYGKDYYSSDTLVLPVSELRTMREQHTIQSVRR